MGERSATCGGPRQVYCAAWESSVTGTQEWGVLKEGLIAIAQQGDNSKALLSFTAKGKQAKRWEAGKSWGLRLHIPGGSNSEVSFTVRLLLRSIVNPLQKL